MDLELITFEKTGPDERVNQNTNLLEMARKGDFSEIKAALLDGTINPNSVNEKDENKFTLLHYAVNHHQFDICKRLIEIKADVNARDREGMIPLHFAAKHTSVPPKVNICFHTDSGSLKFLLLEKSCCDVHAKVYKGGPRIEDETEKVTELLIDRGANISCPDQDLMTPLHYASLHGNLSCAKLLIEKGAKQEAKNFQGKTSLHLACQNGHLQIVQILINNGANLHCKDDFHITPVMFAASRSHLKVVKYLFSKATEKRKLFESKNRKGFPLIHEVFHNKNMELLSFLLDQRHRLETPPETEEKFPSLLQLAAKDGEVEIMKLLIDNGEDISVKNEFSQTPLFLAAERNHIQVVKMLLERGANIEDQDYRNFAPLLVAARNGHSEMVDFLLSNQANINSEDVNGKNILHICAEKQTADVLKKLLGVEECKNLLKRRDNQSYTPFHAAVSKGNEAIVKLFLNFGDESLIEDKTDGEKTSLHLAAMNGFEETIELLANKRKMLIEASDDFGNTPLISAATNGNDSCVEMLLKLGAKIDETNLQVKTALDCAALNNKLSTCATLLKNQDLQLLTRRHLSSALILACKKGHLEIVELLLQKGANSSLCLYDERNALDHAIDAGNEECAKALMLHESWENSLRNRTRRNIAYIIETPMRKLILKMPNVAKEVFKKCIIKTKNNINEDEIYFIFQFLDDELLLDDWLKLNSKQIEEISNKNLPINMTGTNPLLGQNQEKTKKIQKSSLLLRKNHPLSLVVKSKNADLLVHPLVVSLIQHKWKCYGRYVYYLNLFFTLCFVVFLNAFALNSPPPYVVNSTATNFSTSCVSIRKEAQHLWGSDCYSIEWRPTVLVMILSVIGLIKELFQVASYRLEYFKSFINYMECVTFVISILYVVDLTEVGGSTGIHKVWQWELGTIAVLFSWLNLIVLMANIPVYGIYVQMFSEITKSFLLFFVVFMFFIFGFATSFRLLFQNKVAFSFWWSSCIKTFSMMLGEFDYEAIFNTNTDNYMDAVEYPVVSYFVYLLFLVAMSIIIVNLLVGLAVGDISKIQENASIESLKAKIKLILDIEYTIPYRIRSRFIKKEIKHSSNKHNNNCLAYFFDEEENSLQKSANQALSEKIDSDTTQKDVKKILEEVSIFKDTLEKELKNIRFFMKQMEHVVIESGKSAENSKTKNT